MLNATVKGEHEFVHKLRKVLNGNNSNSSDLASCFGRCIISSLCVILLKSEELLVGLELVQVQEPCCTGDKNDIV